MLCSSEMGFCEMLYTKHILYRFAKDAILRHGVVVVTQSDQPKPPAVAGGNLTIVRQNGLSSTSCRASVAVTPVSQQIWWIQVVASTTGTSPLLRGPVTIPHLGTDSKDLICRYITSFADVLLRNY